MADVIEAYAGAPGDFTASARWEEEGAERVTVTNDDGVHHGYRRADQSVVIVARVTPSAAKQAELETERAAEDAARTSRETASSSARSKIRQHAEKARGGGNMTPSEVREFMVAVDDILTGGGSLASAQRRGG